MITDFWKEVIHFFITLVFTLVFVPVIPLVGTYLDRKILGLMQDRLGPTYVGPFGSLQSLVDMVKLLSKEDIKASATDTIIFTLAPVIFLAPIITTFVILPFSPYMTVSALETGLILYVALSSLDVIGVFMAGWGSNNKYALMGGLRSAAQMISYELPLVLSLVPVIMLTSVVDKNGLGSISLSEIITAQMRPWWLWFVLIQPLGLLIYYTCGLAETNRSPFDLPEAESELVAGYLTEYSGLRWAMFFLGEYANMVIVSVITVALFLGGWSGPGADQGLWVGLLGDFGGAVVFNLFAVFWFMVKLWTMIFIFVWIRATLPRLRADQLMRFAWLVLMPITLANILISGLVLLGAPELMGGTMMLAQVPVNVWILGAVNWLMFFVYVFLLGRATGVSVTGRTPRWMRRRAAARAKAQSATQPAALAQAQK
ncbi:MAG TPA: NADH-quinone oxidoreductase subunit NuoH [Ktedonobacterales bacterium]|jgi:NADH-quinone oxidoreductase subunit H